MKDYRNYYKDTNDRMLSDSLLIFEKQLQTNEGADVVVDNVPCRALIYNHLNDLNELKEERVLSCKKDIKIHRGSIVKLGNEIYIVCTDIDDHIVYFKAKIQKTNDYLTYAINQKTTNEKIFKIPAIISDQTLYTDGIKEGKFFNVGDTMMNYVVGASEDTRYIRKGMRFLIDSNGEKVAYKITNMNTTTKKGLLLCTLKESNDIIPEDDLINGIAYNEIKNTNETPSTPTNPTIPPDPIYSLQGSDILDTKTIQTYTVVGQNNIPTTDKEFKFSFEQVGDVSFTSLVSIKSIDINSRSLIAKSNYTKGSFILVATCATDNSITLKREIKVV